MSSWRHTSQHGAAVSRRAARGWSALVGVVALCSAAAALAWPVPESLSGSQVMPVALAWDDPPSAAVAQGAWDDPPPAGTVQRGGPVSLQEATRMALQRHPGRVAGAETVTRGDGRREHRIRILTEDNRVRNVRIDAQTGRFL
jgi:hypothetical protein